MMVQFLGDRSDGCHKGERMREVRETYTPGGAYPRLTDQPGRDGRAEEISSEDSFAGRGIQSTVNIKTYRRRKKTLLL